MGRHLHRSRPSLLLRFTVDDEDGAWSAQEGSQSDVCMTVSATRTQFCSGGFSCVIAGTLSETFLLVRLMYTVEIARCSCLARRVGAVLPPQSPTTRHVA